MEINILELRNKPRINFLVGYQWMSKMSVEDLEKWQAELIEEIRSSIEADGREIKKKRSTLEYLKKHHLLKMIIDC